MGEDSLLSLGRTGGLFLSGTLVSQQNHWNVLIFASKRDIFHSIHIQYQIWMFHIDVFFVSWRNHFSVSYYSERSESFRGVTLCSGSTQGLATWRQAAEHISRQVSCLDRFLSSSTPRHNSWNTQWHRYWE